MASEFFDDVWQSVVSNDVWWSYIVSIIVALIVVVALGYLLPSTWNLALRWILIFVVAVIVFVAIQYAIYVTQGENAPSA